MRRDILSARHLEKNAYLTHCGKEFDYLWSTREVESATCKSCLKAHKALHSLLTKAANLSILSY